MKRLLKNFQIEISGTSYNSEYPATLRSAQIGFLWSPTSGTRGTLYEIRRKTAHPCAETIELDLNLTLIHISQYMNKKLIKRAIKLEHN